MTRDIYICDTTPDTIQTHTTVSETARHQTGDIQTYQTTPATRPCVTTRHMTRALETRHRQTLTDTTQPATRPNTLVGHEVRDTIPDKRQADKMVSETPPATRPDTRPDKTGDRPFSVMN